MLCYTEVDDESSTGQTHDEDQNGSTSAPDAGWSSQSPRGLVEAENQDASESQSVASSHDDAAPNATSPTYLEVK